MQKKYLILVLITLLVIIHLSQRSNEIILSDLPSPPIFSESEITRIRLTKQGTTVELRQSGKTWHTEQNNLPIATSDINSLIDTITNLKIVMLISDHSNYSIFGLDQINRITVEAYNEDRLLTRFQIGSTGPSRVHTFILLDNDPKVYYANNCIRPLFESAIADIAP
ncbi:MAG: DUF4340 domain-containing protein [Nitrospira sp.]|nr:DUF4340 domain-containing protein [bacterium]MBL7049272.1 DUF4340 domain-containing protein [Nitrospira sp.]